MKRVRGVCEKQTRNEGGDIHYRDGGAIWELETRQKRKCVCVSRQCSLGGSTRGFAQRIHRAVMTSSSGGSLARGGGVYELCVLTGV